jgi:hypothetical protein
MGLRLRRGFLCRDHFAPHPKLFHSTDEPVLGKAEPRFLIGQARDLRLEGSQLRSDRGALFEDSARASIVARDDQGPRLLPQGVILRSKLMPTPIHLAPSSLDLVDRRAQAVEQILLPLARSEHSFSRVFGRREHVGQPRPHFPPHRSPPPNRLDPRDSHRDPAAT